MLLQLVLLVLLALYLLLLSMLLLLLLQLLLLGTISGREPLLLGFHDGRVGRGGRRTGGYRFLAHGRVGTGRFPAEVSELEQNVSRRSSTRSILRVSTATPITTTTTAIIFTDGRRRRRLSSHTHRRCCRRW